LLIGLFVVFIFSMIFPFLIISVVILKPKYKFEKSNYKVASKNSFSKTIKDKGIYGEFITFTYLEELNFYKRLLANLYLPKPDGSTTEIDLLMISQTGIYVFESKNYSGWIFGDERHKNWTQTLKGNKKNQFYNPIWQNNGHINALMTVLGMQEGNLFKSIIVFSERCELKKINVASPNVRVIKRDSLINTINQDQEGFHGVLTIEEIERIYLKLQEFNCVDERTKEAHIKNIRDGNRGL